MPQYVLVRPLGLKPLLCVYPTWIENFSVTPTTAQLTDMITVSGKVMGSILVPFPLEGVTVDLYIDDVKRRSTKTAGGGVFSFVIPANEIGLGRHKVYVIKPEEGPACEGRSPEVFIEILTPEEYKERKSQETFIEMLKWGAIIGAVGTVALIGISLYQREKYLQTIMTLKALRG